jgi:hypothetical protein
MSRPVEVEHLRGGREHEESDTDGIVSEGRYLVTFIRPTRARACWRHNFHSSSFERAIKGVGVHVFTFQVNTPGDGAPLFSRARSSERAIQGSSVRILRSASSQSSRS